MQEKKTAMATSVLEGLDFDNCRFKCCLLLLFSAAKKCQLSRADLMYLFELEKRPKQLGEATQSQQKPTFGSSQT